jgi:uncharacterized membrane protein YbhN (UPF0104 family)/tRNA A-37 threonylcarbamoyl transferase component Bud32
VLVLLGAVMALALVGAVARPPAGLERRFMVFVVNGVPSGLVGLWRLLIVALLVWAAALLLVTALVRRWAVLRDLVLAAGLALAVSLLVARLVLASWPPLWDSVWAVAPAGYFPPLSMAVPVAIIFTTSPHLSAPARRVGRWLMVLALVATVAHDSAAPTGVVAALLVGAASAAVLHLVFGSCRGRPSLPDVAEALSDLGVSADELGAAERQREGQFIVRAVGASVAGGSPQRLLVKVYGRDAQDTQLVTATWRKIWYREAGAPQSVGRRAQVEHEAFLTLLAAQGGVRTQSVVTAGVTAHDDVVLVLNHVGQALSDVARPWDRSWATEAWRAVAQLHHLGIGHGQIDADHLIIDGEYIGLIDFRGGTVAPTRERQCADHAQLLVSTVLALGAETALPIALEALGPSELAASLPFVQLTALTAAQRSEVRTAGLDLDAVRDQAAEAADTTAPELQRLQRVSVSSVLQIVVLLGAFVALAAVVGGLDLQALGEELQHATVWLMVTAVLLAQLPRLTAAVSVLGASPSPLSLGPVYALQLATSYLTLAVPTSAARFAVTIRFLQRHGMGADTALVVSAIDTFGQTAVQLAMLAALLLLTSATLHVELNNNVPDQMWWLIAIVGAVAIIAVGVVFAVARWRHAITSVVRRLARSGLDALRGLRSPRQFGLLLSGNIGTELFFALTLQTLTRSFGYQIGLAEILVITIGVRVLTGIVPIPGGIGVAESGLALGLVRAGMPEETAFAAVLIYRAATFYLPPLWGFFALRWLERNKHL